MIVPPASWWKVFFSLQCLGAWGLDSEWRDDSSMQKAITSLGTCPEQWG